MIVSLGDTVVGTIGIDSLKLTHSTKGVLLLGGSARGCAGLACTMWSVGVPIKSTEVRTIRTYASSPLL